MSENIVERARAALVKPLVWESDERWPSSIFSGPSWLAYEIADEGDGDWTVIFPGGTCGVYASPEAAQAAAQADYVARALDSLDLSKLDALLATFTAADLARAWEMGRDAGASECKRLRGVYDRSATDYEETDAMHGRVKYAGAAVSIASENIHALTPPDDLAAKVKEARR